ncbi:hypothetical protein TELCIR_14046 [Teladorsagia circumcincta]|uniref:Cytochrome b5 heme-binding domain-containing protein n=1 Tax=Teladorsagia circumcincta TaxID=45464 RepID=A0A2G9U3S0_TELCI|nr:hypothetical protein TELCIR_14046 [Teladorsagia circumcincta]
MHVVKINSFRHLTFTLGGLIVEVILKGAIDPCSENVVDGNAALSDSRFWAGRDATRAFVSVDFTESGLVGNTDGLSHDDLLGIRDWISFHEKDYKLVGVLVGRYYGANGNPTQELRDMLGRMQTAAEWKASRAAEAEVRLILLHHFHVHKYILVFIPRSIIACF